MAPCVYLHPHFYLFLSTESNVSQNWGYNTFQAFGKHFKVIRSVPEIKKKQKKKLHLIFFLYIQYPFRTWVIIALHNSSLLNLSNVCFLQSFPLRFLPYIYADQLGYLLFPSAVFHSVCSVCVHTFLPVMYSRNVNCLLLIVTKGLLFVSILLKISSLLICFGYCILSILLLSRISVDSVVLFICEENVQYSLLLHFYYIAVQPSLFLMIIFLFVNTLFKAPPNFDGTFSFICLLKKNFPDI